jgi:hypothetical protein
MNCSSSWNTVTRAHSRRCARKRCTSISCVGTRASSYSAYFIYTNTMLYIAILNVCPCTPSWYANYCNLLRFSAANIFLTSGPDVLKLGDFGNSVRLSESVTVKGELCDWVGTPAYMAPEVIARCSQSLPRLPRCVGAVVSHQWRGQMYGHRVECPGTHRA